MDPSFMRMFYLIIQGAGTLRSARKTPYSAVQKIVLQEVASCADDRLPSLSNFITAHFVKT